MIKNIPNKIYLQIDDDIILDNDLDSIDFNELELSWCSEKINKNDIVYYRDQSTISVLEKLKGEIESESTFYLNSQQASIDIFVKTKIINLITKTIEELKKLRNCKLIGL